jgi:hypothetical protein
MTREEAAVKVRRVLADAAPSPCPPLSPRLRACPFHSAESQGLLSLRRSPLMTSVPASRAPPFFTSTFSFGDCLASGAIRQPSSSASAASSDRSMKNRSGSVSPTTRVHFSQRGMTGSPRFPPFSASPIVKACRWAREGVTGPSVILLRAWRDGIISTKQINSRRD